MAKRKASTFMTAGAAREKVIQQLINILKEAIQSAVERDRISVEYQLRPGDITPAMWIRVRNFFTDLGYEIKLDDSWSHTIYIYISWIH